MPRFVRPGMRVKCIEYSREQYGKVGTITSVSSSWNERIKVWVEFDNGDSDEFLTDELRLDVKRGRA